MKNILKVFQILSRKSTLGLLLISIVISLMEVLSVFSVYPIFFYMENTDIIDSVYYQNFIVFITDFLSIGVFESIVLVSIAIVLFTNTMVFFRYLSKSKIKESVVRKNREYVLRLLSDTTILHFSKINSNSIQSFLTIDSERIAQIILSFTNMISAFIVILLMAGYLLFIDLQLFVYLIVIGLLLLIILRKSYAKSKKLGEELSIVNETYTKYISKVITDRVVFMLADRVLITKSFDVDVVRRLHQTKFDIQKYSSYVEFVIKTVTMISILLVMYFFYISNTEISLILFSGVLFVRLIPFISQFGNALQNFKSNLPLVEKLIYLERKLIKSDYIDLNEITLDNISIELKDVKLNNIQINNNTFELKKGNIYGLFGNSGTGKTSLAQSIFGLNYYKSAVIKLNNKYLLSSNKKQTVLRNSIYLSQYNIPSEFSINELFSSFDKKLFTSFLQKFNFLESNNLKFLQRKLSSFSGGEQQKLNFIHAILQEKKVIIFDEPTSSMDDTVLMTIMDTLDAYVIEHNAIIIIISHSQLIKSNIKKAIILK
jgi:ABC-type cobalamin/Fe3+-siderophores transport system ATPase subunit